MQKHSLTVTQAIARSLLIEKGSIYYNLYLKLLKGQTFHTAVQSAFSLSSVNDLFLDFNGGKIFSLYVNGKAVPQDDQRYDGQFIQIPKKYLRMGPNSYFISAKSNYNNQGNGLVSFTDVKGQQFFYSQSEPYYSNLIWPIFDQPDIKARMEMKVLHHKDWMVLSNQHAQIQNKGYSKEAFLAQLVTPYKDRIAEFLDDSLENYVFSMFKPTKQISNYLYCLVAGAYKQVPVQSFRYKDIDFRMFCFQEKMKGALNVTPFLLELTVQGMKFYQQFFDCPFPFSKYDQVFVNQYKWGAMENVGIVTINGEFTFEAMSDRQFSYLCNMIVHELAHMWFGNLVTMTWWEDLWLNQAFADFIANLCLTKIKDRIKLKNIGVTQKLYFNSSKFSASVMDQTDTTHPIKVSVQDTEEAQLNFDQITYQKGAAVLRQLYFLMGQQNFSKGMQAYFKKFQYSNAKFQDLIGSLEHFFHNQKFSLKEWSHEWIQKAGINVFSIAWNPEDKSAKSKMTIFQKAALPAYPTLRYTKFKIALIEDSGKIEELDYLAPPAAESVLQFDNSKGYKCIFLNYQDQAYMKFSFDQCSANWITSNLSKITCPLTKVMIFRSFYNDMRDALLSPFSFIELAFNGLLQKPPKQIYQQLLTQVQGTINSYVKKSARNKYKLRLFEHLKDQMQTLQEGDQRLQSTGNGLIATAFESDHIQFLMGWFDGTNKSARLSKISREMRWRIVTKIFKSLHHSHEIKWTYFSKMKELDSSTSSVQHETMFKVMLSSNQQFNRTFDEMSDIKSYNDMNMYLKRAGGLVCQFNAQRILPLKSTYFKKITQVQHEIDFVRRYINYMYSDFDDDLESDLKAFKTALQSIGQDKKTARMQIKSQISSLERRLRSYSKFG